MKIKYLLIPIIIYYACFLFQELWIGKDSAIYVLLARSLAQGSGYFNYYLPQPEPHTLYPPGYPFILSLVIRIFGDKLLFLRLANIAMVGLSLVILIKLLNKYLKENEVLLICYLFALNPCFLNFTHTITSEVSYLLFSWLGILIFINEKDTLSAKKLLLGTLAIIVGFYIRVVGISLYLALVVYLLLKKKYQQVLFVFCLGLTILPWLIYVLARPGSYEQVFVLKDVYHPSLGMIKFVDIPLRFLSNLKYYAGKVVNDILFYPYFKEVSFGNFFFPVKIFLSLLFSFLFLIGFYSFIKKGIRIVELYILVYVTVLLLYPYHDERFLLPIYPFLLSYVLIIFRAPKLKFARISIISVLLFALIPANINIVKNLVGKKSFSQPAFIETLFWLKVNTPPEAVIMSYDPAGVYFYTERKAVHFALKTDSFESFAEIKEKKINFLLIEKESGLTIRGKKVNNFNRYVRPLIEKYPHCFSLVYYSLAKPEILVYRIDVTNGK